MNQYFYINTEGKQCGTFTPEQLKAEGISKDTMVWTIGMDKWSPADSVPELSFLFINSDFNSQKQEKEKEKEKEEEQQQLPPNYQHQEPNTNTNKNESMMPKTWLVESILVTLFCCLPFGILGIVYSTKIESAYYRGNFNEAKRASREAAKWAKIGFWIGLVGFVLYIAVMIIYAGSFLSNDLYDM